MPAPAGQVCTGGINSFPTAVGFTIEASKYESIPNGYQPLHFEFQWAQELARPTFRNLDSSVAELAASSQSNNTLRYQGTSYTLAKIQLTTAAHHTWLLPLSQISSNNDDLVLTFITADPVKQPKQIIVVVPIVQSQTDTFDPNFLRKLIDPAKLELILPNYDYDTAASLSEFFPPASSTTVISSTLHAYYTICAQGANVNDPPQDILVVVQTSGLRISESLMYLVKEQFNNPSMMFGQYVPLDGTALTIGTAAKFTEPDFQKYVKYAYNLGEALATAPPSKPVEAEKEMAVDAYKCVPFDPETQIKEGKVIVDTTTGKPLTQVQLERKNMRSEVEKTNTNIQNVEDFIQKSSMAMGIIIAIVVFGILIYIFTQQGGGIGTAEQATAGVQRTFVRMAAIPSIAIFSVLFGIVGFIIGFAIKSS